MCIVCFACTTKQDVIDGGVSSPYYDGTIMEYLRSNTEQWGYTVQMIERAGLTDLFEGRVDTVPTMTFFAPPSFAVYRYLMDCKYKGVTEDRYESIEDMPVELCRELILKHVVVGKYLKENIGFRNMDYAIHAKEQDGGTTFTCIGKNQVIAYLERALPYIKQYTGKTVVIKYGGNAMVSDELKAAVMEDIVLLSTVGIKVVLVHGGGPEISAMLKKIGKESRFVDGLRYTDAETMDVVEMVLAGKVNKSLVQYLEQQGGRAIGLCGLDGGMIKAARHAEQDLGFVGDITGVNVTLIRNSLDYGTIPVVATIAAGEPDKNGRQVTYNINADIAASRIAAALGAEKLVLMTDVRGLLRDKDDEDSLISVVHVSEVPQLKMQGVISGGMIPKMDCCVEAVRRGVKRTHIIDGRIPHSILIEMLSDDGIGTMFL